MSKRWIPQFVSLTGAAALALAVAFSPLPLSAQPSGGVGSGENTFSDMSLSPFKIILRGIIHPDEEEATGGRMIKLGVADHQTVYPFDLAKAEAVDNPQTSEYAILQQVGKFDSDFSLIGPKNLLSKIGQSEPGTPLKIVGYFQPRYRRLQLESVEIMGMEN